MNSFLQQLFMHPAMRRGLLSAKVSPRPTPPEPTKAEAERNPQLLVGCRIAIEFLGGRVYEANVVGYDPTSGKHTIRYDEGGEVSYVLAEGRQGHENGRYAILPTELTGPEATLEVLRQVQRTFCYLRDSEMRYFNPKALVDSCKCLNLEFSVYQQNDASEFCDKLLDRLETGLKATPQGTKCLQHALGGKLISQKLPKDCGHRYEREEPFIRLELQIRGKESIEESLSAFVEGEVMDGDNKVECELCGMKKAAVRRTCFGTLPNFLILHLKRFDLDYTTFETVKLNGRCSFPMKLNMKPFTKVGIEESEMSTASKAQPQSPDDNAAMDDDGANDSVENATSGAASPTKNRSSIDNIPTSPKSNSDPEYEYRLQGILVHSGVAQGGHYYSFIYDHDSEKWFKFDDEDVTPFDPANIEAECFGGVQRRTWHGSSNSMEMEVFSNALMLFYEKVVPIEADSSMEVDEEARCEYESEVWKSNEVFLQNSYLFDIEFHEFLREMVQSKYIKEQLPTPPNPTGSPTSMDGVSPPPAASDALVSATSSDEDVHATLARIGVEFVLTVLLHSREKHGVARWITVLAAKFAKHKHICKWFFEALSTTKRAQWLRGLVFECPDSIARQSFVHLVSRALTAYEAHIKIDGHAADLQVLQAFVATLIEFLDATSVMQQTHLEECYMLIRNCAEICPTLRKILKDSDMIARLVNFFLSDRSPQALREAFPSSAVPPLAGRFASPDYQYLLEAIISILGLPRRTSESVLAEGNAQYSHRAVLSQKAQEALTEVFEQFQQQGSLGLEQLKAILRTCSSTNSNTPLIDQKAAAILTKYGNQDNPQAVELDGFLMYYTDAAVTSSKNVLQDLRALGFGEDLKRLPPMLPQSSTVLEGLSALSRGSLLTDVFIESALEEDAETVGDLLLRLSIGDRTTSAILLRSLLHCMNSTETGWKCQPVVDVCSQVAQKILAHECDFQQELIELAMVNPEVGLISTAENREKIRQRYVNNSHVPQFIFRQIVLILDLQVKSVKVKAWLMAHRSMWEWMYEWLRLESLKPALGGRTLVLFREPAKLETLCRLGELLGIPYREEERCYIVEGAGYEDVNGIYRSAAQTHDNCLIYTCQKEDIDYTLFRCCMPSKTRRWYISHSPNKSLLGTMTDEDFYFLQCHIDDELPPETGWKVWAKNEKTQPPAPTVRLYSSTIGNVNGVAINGEEFGEGDAVDCGDGVDGDADADTVEYDDSEDEIRVSNERFQAVHLDNQEDGDRSSGPDDFM
ncbi:TPA: hypothetical protein N0F65_000822 [Lagenidium giganteum]|uniref:USP domain-containing protein n=1 Tax=Lagenidium giganteum TaxID=4803 RepID=A0AAV2YVE4_9STRA|nr:TPA: hypothetical protein N0F65_000822 [Lagenidium giganteum]